MNERGRTRIKRFTLSNSEVGKHVAKQRGNRTHGNGDGQVPQRVRKGQGLPCGCPDGRCADFTELESGIMAKKHVEVKKRPWTKKKTLGLIFGILGGFLVGYLVFLLFYF